MHLDDLTADQEGVVSRRQLLAAGLGPHDLRRLIRRRELVQVHPGVYVNHTGAATWSQSAWAAVLACEPAALAGRSALVLGDRSPEAGPIHVAIPWECPRLRDLQGVRATRRRDFHRLAMSGAPPRIPVEEAAIDLADAARSDMAALAELGSLVQARRTSARWLSLTGGYTTTRRAGGTATSTATSRWRWTAGGP